MAESGNLLLLVVTIAFGTLSVCIQDFYSNADFGANKTPYYNVSGSLQLQHFGGINDLSIKISCMSSQLQLVNKLSLSTKPRRLANLLTLILLSCGDISINPGPPKYPCGCCQKAVRWNQRGVCCDNCDLWYHKQCLSMDSTRFEHLNSSNVSWICCECDKPNHDSSIFHSFEYEVSNQFSVLGSSNISNLCSSPTLPATLQSPVAASSPIKQPRKKLRTTGGPW